MITRKSTFFLGILIFLLPFIGVPSSWKTAFLIIIGLILVFSSIQLVFTKRNTKPRPKKERTQEIVPENTPVYPKDNILEQNVLEVSKSEPEVVKVVRKRAVRKIKSLQ